MNEKKPTAKKAGSGIDSDIKLEDGLKKLQTIVKKLEENECELDEALKLFEEGVGLARSCHKKLDDAEKKIEILTKIQNDEVETKPYSPDGS